MREGVARIRTAFGISERRARFIVKADRKMVRYRSCRPPDTALRVRLWELARERQRFGYRRLVVLLRREGDASGKNRIYRLYREEGLTVRKLRSRRRAIGTRAPILMEHRANARWSLDFVHDQFAGGRRFRILNGVDEVTRECLAAIPDTSISGRRVARADDVDRAPRASGDDCQRQWDRFHLDRHPGLVAGSRRRLALHRVRQADAERLRGIVQWADARRTAEREPVLRPGPRPRKAGRVGMTCP